MSDLLVQARRLAMHARVAREMADYFRRYRSHYRAWAFLFLLLTAIGLWFTWNSEDWTRRIWVAAIGAALASGSWAIGSWLLRRKQKAAFEPLVLDHYFASAYQRELAVHDRADLRALWEIVRDKVLDTLKVVGPNQLPHSFASRRQLRRLEDVMDDEVPTFRRDIADYHRNRRRSSAS